MLMDSESQTRCLQYSDTYRDPAPVWGRIPWNPLWESQWWLPKAGLTPGKPRETLASFVLSSPEGTGPASPTATTIPGEALEGALRAPHSPSQAQAASALVCSEEQFYSYTPLVWKYLSGHLVLMGSLVVQDVNCIPPN